jgi:hypothetical protein
VRLRAVVALRVQLASQNFLKTLYYTQSKHHSYFLTRLHLACGIIDVTLMSLVGTSRQFAATQHFGRFRSEADMHRDVASTASVADDPERTSAGRLNPVGIL